MIELQIEQESGLATLLQINLNGSQANPSDLADLEFPEVEGSKGLVVSGFPQYAAITVSCEYKNKVSWIAIVDPKVAEVKSAVVTWSLNRSYRRGDVVPLSSLDLGSPAATVGS